MKLRRWLTDARVIAVPGTVGLLLFGVWLFFHHRPPYPGNPAPDMTVYSLDRGLAYELRSFRGRWVFLNFWTTWCPPCREEFPALVRLWEQMSSDGRWVFLWVNVAEPDNQVRRFLQDIARGLQRTPELWPVFLDPTGQAGPRFGVWAFPETFLIDPQGRIVERIIGPQAWDQPVWRQRLQDLAGPGSPSPLKGR
jgi:thiol-disulfide isomerase/thioredoxin